MSLILVVEDEESYRMPVKYGLEKEGYEVLAAASGEEGFEIVTSEPVDLVLLDVMLPGMDGITLLRRIREHSAVPVIMVTAKSSEIDTVVGLEMGADDYIAKPYSFRELLARVRAQLRRTNMDAKSQVESRSAASETTSLSKPLVCGPVAMDVASHEVAVRGESVFFPLKEFEVLQYLLTHQGQVVPRAKLIDRVWGSDYVGDTKTLDVHIKRIRAKIEQDPSRPELLTTVRGLGYRINDAKHE